LLGLRGPSTSVSAAETKYLGELSHGRRCIVEVGVFEGATSQVFCREMDPAGRAYLVDPYFPTVRLEKLLNLSFTQKVATKSVRPWMSRAEFVRQPSHVAAEMLPLKGKADFIFIDAVHTYEAVSQDFQCWAPMLTDDGVIAFHDSHPCPARPDLSWDEGVPRFIAELTAGKHAGWQIIGHVDSVTAIKRAETQ
jgi:hypothetical protein